MPAFDYIAIDAQGKRRKGALEGDSARHIRQQLRERALTPLAVELADEKPLTLHRPLFGQHLGIRQLALMTRQLAALVQAGMPLTDVLGAVAEQSESARARRIVTALRARVREGYSLAHALADFPGTFDRLFRATIAAGEQSGYLDRVLAQLADYIEQSHEFRQKVQLALIYPVLLVVLSFAIVTGLMVYVVPDVIKVFTGTGQPLPALTRGLVALSDFTVAWGWLVALVAIALVAGFRVALRNPAWRRAWHRRYLRWPLVRKLSRGINAARYINTLSILTQSSVPLVDAMHIAGEVVGNDYIREQVGVARRQVSEGATLYDALGATGCFPSIMLHMIASGEASGELDAMLARTAHQQQRDLQVLVATLVALFEPLMLLTMGAVVMLIVLAILLPILSLNQLVV